MGNCHSKPQVDENNTIYNEDEKVERLFKAGVQFKAIEFNRQIGFTTKK